MQLLACAALFLALLSVGAFADVQYPPVWTLTGGNEFGVGEGFNIRSMKQTTFPLFDFSKPSSEIITILGTPYSLPENLYAKEVNTFVNDSRVQIFESFEQFQKMKATSWGVSVGVTLYGVGVDLSLSKVRGQINGMLKNSSRAANIASCIWHTFDLEVDWSDAPLDQDFMNDVARLPAQYNPAAPDDYKRFISFYGTHFFSKAGYGCKYNFSLAYDKTLNQTQGSHWTATQVGISVSYSLGTFGIGLGMNMSKFKNETKIDSTFREHATGTENLLGGDELLLSKGLDVWLPTCKFQRAQLLEKSSLRPLPDIIRDPARKNSLIAALRDFASHADW